MSISYEVCLGDHYLSDVAVSIADSHGQTSNSGTGSLQSVAMFRLHKYPLAKQSAFFAALFRSHPSISEFYVDQFPADARVFRLLSEAIYETTPEQFATQLSPENIISVLMALQYLQIGGVLSHKASEYFRTSILLNGELALAALLSCSLSVSHTTANQRSDQSSSPHAQCIGAVSSLLMLTRAKKSGGQDQTMDAAICRISLGDLLLIVDRMLQRVVQSGLAEATKNANSDNASFYQDVVDLVLLYTSSARSLQSSAVQLDLLSLMTLASRLPWTEAHQFTTASLIALARLLCRYVCNTSVLLLPMAHTDCIWRIPALVAQLRTEISQVYEARKNSSATNDTSCAPGTTERKNSWANERPGTTPTGVAVNKLTAALLDALLRILMCELSERAMQNDAEPAWLFNDRTVSQWLPVDAAYCLFAHFADNHSEHIGAWFFATIDRFLLQHLEECDTSGGSNTENFGPMAPYELQVVQWERFVTLGLSVRENLDSILGSLLLLAGHKKLAVDIGALLEKYVDWSKVSMAQMLHAAQHETGRMPSSIFMLALTQKVAVLSAQLATLQLQLTHQKTPGSTSPFSSVTDFNHTAPLIYAQPVSTSNVFALPTFAARETKTRQANTTSHAVMKTRSIQPFHMRSASVNGVSDKQGDINGASGFSVYSGHLYQPSSPRPSAPPVSPALPQTVAERVTTPDLTPAMLAPIDTRYVHSRSPSPLSPLLLSQRYSDEATLTNSFSYTFAPGHSNNDGQVLNQKLSDNIPRTVITPQLPFDANGSLGRSHTLSELMTESEFKGLSIDNEHMSDRLFQQRSTNLSSFQPTSDATTTAKIGSGKHSVSGTTNIQRKHASHSVLGVGGGDTSHGSHNTINEHDFIVRGDYSMRKDTNTDGVGRVSNVHQHNKDREDSPPLSSPSFDKIDPRALRKLIKARKAKLAASEY